MEKRWNAHDIAVMCQYIIQTEPKDDHIQLAKLAQAARDISKPKLAASLWYIAAAFKVNRELTLTEATKLANELHTVMSYKRAN